MPTTAKPKHPVDLHDFPLSLEERDKRRILECLGIDPRIKRKKAATALAVIERDLSRHANMMHRRGQEPLPAHIAAALQPIAKAAGALARLVEPSLLPVAVLRALNRPDVADGDLWQTMMDLRARADLAILRMSGKNSAGLHVKQAGERLDTVRNALRLRFEALRRRPSRAAQREEYEGSWEEFWNTCRGYLPAVPTARKRRVP